jgi:hypothetical protein
MAPVMALAPIAAQLARSISLNELFPRGQIEDLLRQHRAAAPQGEARLPADVEPFFGHYAVVIRAAAALLGAPAFDRLARLHEDVQDEYMPGGPPQSPVYDSIAMQLVLGAVPQGTGSETPYSVLARLLQRDPSRARLQRMALSLAQARFELYRVRSAEGHDAEVEPVRGGAALRVRLTGPFLRTGDFGLMRVLPFDGGFFIADSPYLLKASEEDWLDHLARMVARQQTPAPTPSPPKASKLSSKEQARRRQREKAKASRNTPEEIIERYFQFGSSERYWLDYIMDAYAGERNGIVFLAGVPDRPELLPHSDKYEPAPRPQLSPLAQLREALMRIAAKEGLFELAMEGLKQLCGEMNVDQLDLTPNEQNLLVAYATLGLRGKDGTTSLARFERSRAAEALHPEARSFIDSVKKGWFTALRVDRIHLDEGLEVFDLLRAEKLRIRERSATRQLALGDLILGWLCQDAAGTLTLEGGIAHVPALATEPILLLIGELRRAMPPVIEEQAWKDQAADLPMPLLAGILALRSNPPLPRLLNTGGDPLQVVTGHYRVRDYARVVATLSREFEENADGTYSWFDAAGTLLARLELSPTMLRVQVNSRKRLKSSQKRLETLLGDSVERSLEVHEDVEQALRTHSKRTSKPSAEPQPLELPMEVAAELNKVVLAQLRSSLDQPIPQFQGKTLRFLARTVKGRPDAIAWLRQQERILRSNPQLAGLDMRPLWREIDLPFQGLDTDPPV